MKITLFGSKNFDSLEYHLNDSFTFLGHSVTHINIEDIVAIPYKYSYMAAKFINKYDKFLFRKAAKKIIESEPELIVCTYRFTHPICIQLIKCALPSVKVIHINPDALTTFENQQVFASSYDAFFTKDPFIVDFMKNKMGLNTYYLPEACNPRVHNFTTVDRNKLEHDLDTDVVTFGTMYPYRANMISELVKNNINVKLFGTPDRRFPSEEISRNFQNEFIRGTRKSEIVLGSKIVFNNFHYAEIQSANVKFFEIGGIGGFQICDYKPTLQDYSLIDVSDFTYKSIGEALDLINFYLDKPALRHKIADQQREHFIKNHTYENRINKIFESL